ncbi:MAG: LysM peptidoglycan-binding domain-containing protein [Treponema sp.]|jgi:PKD repeat protein|nr:LysM peptidoglycan-binding domain-containing protein [Treponema sp.]
MAMGKLTGSGRRALLKKILGPLGAAVLAGGAVLWACFALTAPRLPRDNLLAVLAEMAEYNAGTEDAYSLPPITLPPDETQWAALTRFAGTETGPETGTGTAAADRSQDITYQVRPGETLSGIAVDYGISYNLLAYYNNITNANRIRAGTAIVIPSWENVKITGQNMAGQPRRPPAARVNRRNVKIGFESRPKADGTGMTAQFFILDPEPESLQSFAWDFGDGKRALTASPSHEYTRPKTYTVRLSAQDGGGNVYTSNALHIDIPHPESAAAYSSIRFVTLSDPDEWFVTAGKVAAAARYASLEDAPLDFSESDEHLTKVRFKKPGFYGLTIEEEPGMYRDYSVFVSPRPSVHADMGESAFDWYRTQFDTGTTSNCGPASVSMAIGWALEKYLPVSSVRQAVGWKGDGGTSFEDLLRVIRSHGIPVSVQPFHSMENIKEVVDSGRIAIVLFHTSGVKTSRSKAADLFDKYYTDSVGHYIIVKGYSLDGEYFAVYDPIPSDWGTNRFRYGDEVSMMGRNRYYSSAELLRSLRRKDMIVVSRPNP